MEINKIYNIDCIKGMQQIEDNSIDMILCDLPYGMTACKWDSVIPFESLWKEYKRIIKKDGNIVLFGSQPFTSSLVSSNPTWFSHCWVWQKENGTNFLNVKKMPFKIHEDILVFRPPSSKSNKGMFLEEREYMYSEYRKTGLTRTEINRLLGNQMSSHYFTQGSQFALPNEEKYRMLQRTGFFQKPYSEFTKSMKGKKGTHKYYPQMTKGKPYKTNGTKKTSEIYKENLNGGISYNKGVRYPVSVLEFQRDKEKLHPTQKPVALCRYLIRTYTKEEDTVLDNCMGSGTTALACLAENRNYIGFEKEEKYCKMAEERILNYKLAYSD